MGQKANLNLGTFNLSSVSEFKVVVENPNGAADNTANNTNITKLSGDFITVPNITVVSQSSNATGNGANLMVDGSNSTIWHNNWQAGAALPHTLVFNLNGTYNLGGLDMLNRLDNSNGYPKDVEISTSVDNITWTTPVTTTFSATTNWQTAYFTGAGAKFLRMKVISTISGASTCSMAEIKLRGCTSNPFPTVSISSPTNNATFTAPASVTINATAGDDGSVTKVEFYNGNTLLGSDASSPYSYTWTGVTAGNYAITAVATDNLGATTTSTVVNIVVNVPANKLPVTSITSPANNATFTAPASIKIDADAIDNDGTISKVEFYNGATLLGTDVSSTYSYTWTGVPAGNYALTVKATDNSNGVTTSTVVNVVVNPPANVPPVVSITAPTTNSSYTAPATINFTVDATDGDGNITKVEFYNGATLIGTDVSFPYSFTWTGVAIGNYTITAKATDNSNAVTTSTAISVSVTKAANQLPTVSLTAPTNNAVFQAVASAITLTAIADDKDGSVSKVVFYNGSTKLGEDASFPYSLIWNNVAAGTYTLKALAYDNVNDSTTSTLVTIKVNKAPVTSITSPTSNSNFTTSSNVVIDALANDNDGTISKVEFFQGTTLIGSDLTSPYSFTWNNVQDGTYLLKTKVTDNDGGVTYSAGVTIIVGTLTAIDATSTETKIIYPNPTTGKLYFGKGVSNVQIFSTDGKVLPISYSLTDEYLDLHSLKNGIYVIQFEKDGKHFSEKITKL